MRTVAVTFRLSPNFVTQFRSSGMLDAAGDFGDEEMWLVI